VSRHAPARVARSPLPVLATAQLLIALDFSVVYVALPSIGAELRFQPAGLQWVVTAYALAFAGLLLLCGRVADVLGARRLFLGGLAVFAISSLVAGFADSPGLLIAMRTLQGAGAAMLAPSTLALLSAAFPAGEERNRALAVWGTTGAGGLAVGALVGGLLTSVSWRLVFLAVVPIAAVTLFVATDLLPRTPREATGVSLDVVGVLLGIGGVVAAVFALTQAAERGWLSVRTWLPGVGGALLLAALVVWERLNAEPFLPGELLCTRSLRLGSGIAALFMASLGAEFFLFTLFIQDVRDYDAAAAGLAFLPFALSMIVGNLLAGRVAGPLGVRWMLLLAFVTGGAGLTWLAVAALNGAGFWTGLLPGLVISGVGQGVAFTGVFVAGTADLAQYRQGIGSGLLTTVQHVGGSVALAGYVLLLGERPGAGEFGAAFLVCAGLAVTAGLVALGFRPGTRRMRAAVPDDHLPRLCHP
jgi:EmrB/QacA subfamily drug resistance transporter